MNQWVHLVWFNGIAICYLENDCTRLPELNESISYFNGVRFGAQLTLKYAGSNSSDLLVHVIKIDGSPPLAIHYIETQQSPSRDMAALLCDRHVTGRSKFALPEYAPNPP